MATEILTPQPAYRMGPERSMVLPKATFPQYDLGESYDDFAGVWPFKPEGSAEEAVRHTLVIAGGLWLGIMVIGMTARAMNR